MRDPIEIDRKPIAAVREPGLRTLYDYWNRIRDGHRFALRERFDPADIPGLLKDLFYVDVEINDDGPQFRYRVVGTGIAAFIGEDYTGRTLDEVFGEPARSIMRRCYAAPIWMERPVYSSTILRFPARGTSQVISRLILPMSRDGKDADQLLNGQSYGPQSNAAVDWNRAGDFELLEIFAVDPE